MLGFFRSCVRACTSFFIPPVHWLCVSVCCVFVCVRAVRAVLVREQRTKNPDERANSECMRSWKDLRRCVMYTYILSPKSRVYMSIYLEKISPRRVTTQHSPFPFWNKKTRTDTKKCYSSLLLLLEQPGIFQCGGVAAPFPCGATFWDTAAAMMLLLLLLLYRRSSVWGSRYRYSYSYIRIYDE